MIGSSSRAVKTGARILRPPRVTRAVPRLDGGNAAFLAQVESTVPFVAAVVWHVRARPGHEGEVGSSGPATAICVHGICNQL